MKVRCSNPNYRHFSEYGGRGIVVCAEWADDFTAFRGWANANGYEPGLEIDRRDTDGPYSPANCRWATHKQNNRNQRKKRPAASTSQYKGVHWAHRSGKWRAAIRSNEGPTKYLGLFANEVDAARAYDAAAKEIQGDFARLNFPETV